MRNILIDHNEMRSTFLTILKNHFSDQNKIELLADIFTNNSIDGIYSHGVNRFERFINDVVKGYINSSSEPTLKNANNGIEQWNGNLAPGPYIATKMTERSVELASKYGIGCVAVANSNHWMRGGTYGWQAAQNNCALIAWTNTIANMPAWGAKDCKLGNNPLVFAAPYEDSAIVLDMAMSQYSYGAIKNHKRDNQTLSQNGGYNAGGFLTKNPEEILESGRALPMGYWKGSGLSLLLDIFSTILSGGLSTADISKNNHEFACSQVFISININTLQNPGTISDTIKNIILDFKSSDSVNDDLVRYPGEKTLKIRHKQLKSGIPVNIKIWENILKLSY